MSARIGIKTVKLYTADPDYNDPVALKLWDKENQEALNALDWSFVEETLNDQLPDGYYAKVEN